MTALEDAETQTAQDEAEALLSELRHASQLMERLAAAKGVLSAQHRLKADQMGRNMKSLYRSSRRRLGGVSD